MVRGPRALCSVCKREFLLLRDGRIGYHGSKDKTVWPPQPCKGWGLPPLKGEK